MNVQSIYHQSALLMEEELGIIQLAKNDPRHFGPLYKKYHQQIFRYVQQRIDDPELACDITSQVFVKALTNIHKFEFRGVPFSSWLYRIAKSELYQSFRDRKVEMNSYNLQFHLDTREDDFEDETSQQQKRLLLHALSALKKHELNLIELRFFEKRSFKEIGELQNITENNAKVKTFRALEKLRTLFKNKFNTQLQYSS
jgi:RNA polymerase sigma-70 factor (ECF subfamily)